MSDDSNAPHRRATDTDFKLPQTQQIQPVGVQFEPESDDNTDPVPPAPAKKRRRFRLKSLLQFRLWLLLLLFVPVAWYFKDYANRPSITYIEEKNLFWKDGMTELDFLKKPDGSPLARHQNVDSAF